MVENSRQQLFTGYQKQNKQYNYNAFFKLHIYSAKERKFCGRLPSVLNYTRPEGRWWDVQGLWDFTLSTIPSLMFVPLRSQLSVHRLATTLKLWKQVKGDWWYNGTFWWYRKSVITSKTESLSRRQRVESQPILPMSFHSIDEFN